MEDGEDYNELELGSKISNRIIKSATKTGYREGVEEGSQQILQSDFDKGYEDGFKVAFILGKYKALAEHFLQSYENPPEIGIILETTRRGECYICKLGIANHINQSESSKVIDVHKNYLEDMINGLNSHFIPLLMEKEINFNNLSLN